MSEFTKTGEGLLYHVSDPEAHAKMLRAEALCRKLEQVDVMDHEGKQAVIRELFGSCGERVSVQPGFHCDRGFNIHVGSDFLANYNVTILDIAEVRVGSHVLLAPGTLITTVGHPLSPKERREYVGIARPVTIGNDVWIGANCTILPGVTIGNNVVVAAGAVVADDVPDNCVIGGVPARKIREIEDDTK